MKKTAVLLVAVMLLLTVAGAIPAAAASGTCGENIFWSLEEGVLTLTGSGDTVKYERSEADDSVPTPWWSMRDTITSIVVEEGIAKLDNYLFYRCSNVTSVTLPSSLQRIETRVFKGCTALSAVTFPEKLAYIGYEACVETGITEITFLGSAPKTSTTPPFTGLTATVNYNGDSNFLAANYGGNLTWNIVSPGGNEEEPGEQFVLENPEKEGSCGSNATWAYKDGTLVISGSGEMDKFTRNTDLDKINSDWFDWRDDIQTIVVNPGITRINNYAFYRCANLESVTIPSSVVAVNFGAFKGCTALKEIALPKGVIEVGSQAFAESGLQKIVFHGPLPWDVGDLMADGVTATVYYPCTEPEVTQATIKVYGGTLTWARLHDFEGGVCKDCGINEADADQDIIAPADPGASEPGEATEPSGDTDAPEEKKTNPLSILTIVNLCLTVVALGAIILSIVLVVKLTRKDA